MKTKENLLVRAHAEVDNTLDRLKIWRKKLQNIAFEVEADIAALTALQMDIEAEFSKDEEKEEVSA